MIALHQFRVRVGRRQVSVALWPDLPTFRERTGEARTTALAFFIYDDESTGCIHFRKGFCTTEIIAHESLHAIMRLCRAAKRDSRSGDGEEWAAEATGQLTARICGELAEHGLWEGHG